jgi:hypothetical protein
MAAVLPATSIRRTNQAKVGLMDQRGGVRGVIGPFVGHPGGRDLAQLVIYQRQELLRRRRVAGLDLRENASDLVHSGRRLGPCLRVATRTDAGATSLGLESDQAASGAGARGPG